MKRIIISATALLFFAGCAQKNEIKYYLLSSNSKEQVEVKKSGVVLVESVSYLSGDKIWYLKDGVFLPYKNSFFAKTPKEFVAESMQALNIREKVMIKIADAYQIYDSDKSSFLLSATVEIGDGASKTVHKNFKIVIPRLGVGAGEAAKGFEMCVLELLVRVKSDLAH